MATTPDPLRTRVLAALEIPGLPKHPVRTAGAQNPFAALGMYFVTLICELPCAMTRAYLAFFVVWALSAITGVGMLLRTTIALAAGFAPYGWSLCGLIWPSLGDWWFQQESGGRPPSEREAWAYADAILELREHATAPLPPPSRVFIVDDRSLNSFAWGRALAIHSALIDDPAISAVIAHELGHLNGIETRIGVALERLALDRLRPRKTKQPISLGRHLWRATRRLAAGGVGLLITRPYWGPWQRQREFAADRYAATLGQARQLATYLERHAIADDRPVPWIWLTAHTHPYTEHRIEALNRFADQHPALDQNKHPTTNQKHPDRAAPDQDDPSYCHPDPDHEPHEPGYDNAESDHGETDDPGHDATAPRPHAAGPRGRRLVADGSEPVKPAPSARTHHSSPAGLTEPAPPAQNPPRSARRPTS